MAGTPRVETWAPDTLNLERQTPEALLVPALGGDCVPSCTTKIGLHAHRAPASTGGSSNRPTALNTKVLPNEAGWGNRSREGGGVIFLDTIILLGRHY